MRAKNGIFPHSSLHVINNANYCQHIIFIYKYNELLLEIISGLQVYPQRFLAQAFHRYVIQVIATNTEAVLVKSKKHTFGKGRAVQETQIPPRDFNSTIPRAR